MKTQNKQIYLKARRAKMYLRIRGFLPDTENSKIQERIEKFGDKHNIQVDQSDVDKQRLI